MNTTFTDTNNDENKDIDDFHINNIVDSVIKHSSRLAVTYSLINNLTIIQKKEWVNWQAKY